MGQRDTKTMVVGVGKRGEWRVFVMRVFYIIILKQQSLIKTDEGGGD